jgi:hypothetical protein
MHVMLLIILEFGEYQLGVFLWESIRLHDPMYRDDGKGKAVPFQAWSGPEGSRKLRFPDFMTTV